MVLKVVIFIYIIVWKCIANYGYTTGEAPIGNVRLSLQPPVSSKCENHHGPDQSCDPDSPNYMFGFQSTTQLSYCADHAPADDKEAARDVAKHCGSVGKPCPCRFMDAIDLAHGPLPAAGGSPFYITTRATEYRQQRAQGCGRDAETCPETFQYRPGLLT
jgi:hypothetical protein